MGVKLKYEKLLSHVAIDLHVRRYGAVLFDPAPCIWLKPVLLTDMAVFQHYACPVYRTAERRGVLATTGHSTNFLMMMKMPTVGPRRYSWPRHVMSCTSGGGFIT